MSSINQTNTTTTTTDSKMERKPLEHSKVLPLSISNEQIGMLVGAKGVFLKKFVFGPTMRELDDSDAKILFSVKEEDGKVNGHLSASTKDALDLLEQNVVKHVDATLKKSERSAQTKQQQADGLSTFVFKATLPHDKMGDFIGRAGRNVNNIQCEINDLDVISKAQTNVSITKNRFVNTKNCHFSTMNVLPAVTTMKDEAEERGEKFEMPYVIITVKTYTSNRRGAWEKIKEILNTALNSITQDNRNGGSFNDNYLDE